MLKKVIYSIFISNQTFNYKYRRFKLIFVWSLSIWNLSTSQLKAVELDENRILDSQFLEPITSISYLENPSFNFDNNIKNTSIVNIEPEPILIAAPENFNPGLSLPPPPPPPKVKPQPTSTEPNKPFAVLENIQTDFDYDSDNFGQSNIFIEPTAQFRLQNGNIIRFKTGVNYFSQAGFESITNIPLQAEWEGKIGDMKLQTGMGVDLFNRLPTDVNFNVKLEAPISPAKVSPSGKLTSLIVFSANLEQKPYKFNAQTLENQITALRFGPNLFWQIDRNTSLFSSYRWGSYNDGNLEQQSFSRLERKIGQFSLAANLFTWNYTQDVQTKNGYFSPPDFLVYNAELGWQGDIFDSLHCRLAIFLGQQRLRGKFDNANSYRANCTAKLLPNLELDFGYTFSNVRNKDTGNINYINNAWQGQLRLKF